jgi:pyrimidine deaminase RibD-like protein
MSSNYIDLEMQYLQKCLAIAKTSRKNDIHLLQPRGAILVQHHEILATGFDNPKTGEYAELMALNKARKNTIGANLYVSMFFSSVWDTTQIDQLINSKIQMLVYGYNNPRLIDNSEYQQNLRKLEGAGIKCIYLRIPEILTFYAPYRFAEGIDRA